MTVLPLPTATISGGGDVCSGGVPLIITFTGNTTPTPTPPYTFTFTINGGNAGTITSTNGSNSVSLPVLTDDAGTYIYSLVGVADANGCSQIVNGNTATAVINEKPLAIFTVSPEQTTILEPTITITNLSVSATSWMWNFGDGGISQLQNPPPHTYADTGTYKITLVASNSVCKDSTYHTVRITFPFTLYIPNAFSPNTDGVNDEFKPQGDGILTFKMMIFDRWGNMIFFTEDINKGWDGRANGGKEVAQMDTYVYVIFAKELSNKHDHEYRGIVTLINSTSPYTK